MAGAAGNPPPEPQCCGYDCEILAGASHTSSTTLTNRSRFIRYDVDLPVQFRNPLGQSFTARMKNVSEGGLAIKLVDPVRLKGVVMVEFELPSVEPRTLHAKADVVWSDSLVMGLRFLYIDKDSGVALQTWLDSLEAQFRFRESAQRTC
jgi:hypothetical protein